MHSGSLDPRIAHRLRPKEIGHVPARYQAAPSLVLPTLLRCRCGRIRARAKRHRDPGGLRSVVVPHAVINGSGAGTRSNRHDFRVGFLGRLDPKKNLELVIDALALLSEPVTLQVAGDGPRAYRESLVSRAQSRGVETRVRWHGFVEDATKRQFLASIDVLVMPSTFECFGVSAAEALAAGVPVVVSPHVGVADIVVEYRCGHVVSATAPEIARALRELDRRRWRISRAIGKCASRGLPRILTADTRRADQGSLRGCAQYSRPPGSEACMSVEHVMVAIDKPRVSTQKSGVPKICPSGGEYEGVLRGLLEAARSLPTQILSRGGACVCLRELMPDGPLRALDVGAGEGHVVAAFAARRSIGNWNGYLGDRGGCGRTSPPRMPLHRTFRRESTLAVRARLLGPHRVLRGDRASRRATPAAQRRAGGVEAGRSSGAYNAIHGRLKNVAIALAAFDRHFHVDGYHVRFFSDSALRRMLYEEGFEVERLVHYGRFPGLWAGVFVWGRRR